MEFQKTTGFLKNAYYQGHGRYVNQIVRLTLKFCKSSGASTEVRKFIETRLVDVARKNPGCVIYVKPRIFKTPVMTADYLNGCDQYISLSRMSCAQVEAWMSWFLTRSGYELHRLNRASTTYRPSIQGIWTPFYFRDPKTNLVQFPSEEYSAFKPKRPSATEQLQRLASQSSSSS